MSVRSLLALYKQFINILLALTLALVSFLSPHINNLPGIIPGYTPDFSKLSLPFLLDTSQASSAITFVSRGIASEFSFSASEIRLQFASPSPQKNPPGYSAAVSAHAWTNASLHFLGANPAVQLAGEGLLPATVNNLHGNDPAKWVVGRHPYAGIVYRQLYPGIDLHYSGTGQSLESTYVVAPLADPGLIQWQYAGATRVEVEKATGNLLVTVPSADVNGKMTSPVKVLTEKAPTAWQTIAGKQIPVDSRFATGGNDAVRFTLGSYNPQYPLIIDPTLSYSTFLGGSETEIGLGITLDLTGAIYITGETLSANYPTKNPIQGTFGGGICQFAIPCEDVFVTKISADGSTIIYSTFLGGDDDDHGSSIAVDQQGNAYIAGVTYSYNFPTANPLQAALNNQCTTFPYHCSDAFVAKINTDGNSLLFSTYLGGDFNDYAYGIKLDDHNNMYITGYGSDNYPTVNPIPVPGTGGGTILTKLSADGKSLVYSTFLNKSNVTSGQAITVDKNGNAYVTGKTGATNLPTVNPLQKTNAGYDDVFLSKINADGSAFVYSTYLGGSLQDGANAIAVDATGNVYLTGFTVSRDFPTRNAVQTTMKGLQDAFVTKVNADGSAILYSTYLGGSGYEDSKGIALSQDGQVTIGGATQSSNFPLLSPFQNSLSGGGDAFVAKLSANGCSLIYSTYLGGSNASEAIHALVIDANGTAYVTGVTASANFPTMNPLQGTYGGANDAFVTIITEASTPPVIPCRSNFYLPLVVQ